MDAGDDTGHLAIDDERDRDHGVGPDPEALIEEGAMLGVGADRVFTDGLAGCEDVADDATVQGLPEFTDEVRGVGAGAQNGVEEFAGGEPEGSILGGDSFGGSGQELPEQIRGDVVDQAVKEPVGRAGGGRVHQAEELTPFEQGSEALHGGLIGKKFTGKVLKLGFFKLTGGETLEGRLEFGGDDIDAPAADFGRKGLEELVEDLEVGVHGFEDGPVVF